MESLKINSFWKSDRQRVQHTSGTQYKWIELNESRRPRVESLEAASE